MWHILGPHLDLVRRVWVSFRSETCQPDRLPGNLPVSALRDCQKEGRHLHRGHTSSRPVTIHIFFFFFFFFANVAPLASSLCFKCRRAAAAVSELLDHQLVSQLCGRRRRRRGQRGRRRGLLGSEMEEGVDLHVIKTNGKGRKAIKKLFYSFGGVG